MKINKKYKVHTRSNIRGEEKQIDITCTLLPMWCENAAGNIQNIKGNSLSKLICKTYPECWKAKKLIDMFTSKTEYELSEIKEKCKLSVECMEHIINTHPSSIISIAGTDDCNECENYIQTNKPALVIANGPSLMTNNHLSLLKQYGFKGDIFCATTALPKILESGTVPTYINSLDAEEHPDVDIINNDLVRNNLDKMTGIFGITTHPKTCEIFTGKKYFYSGYIDDSIIPNISHLFYLITKTPQVLTGGNVGMACVTIATILGYNPVVMIGMDLSFPTFDEMKHYYDTIIHTWDLNPKDYQWIENKSHFKYMNPDFNKEYYCDLTFYTYKVAGLKMIDKFVSKGNVKIINCTEQGALHSKDIIPMKFIDYLKNQ